MGALLSMPPRFNEPAPRTIFFVLLIGPALSVMKYLT